MVIDGSCRFHTADFEFDSVEKEFTADASELFFGRPVSVGPHAFGQLYNDACDVGITLISTKTGNASQFYLAYEHFVDGELKYCELRPTQETTYNFPALEGYTVVIFND